MEINFVQGFYCLLAAVIIGIPMHLTASIILGIGALIWLGYLLAQDIYYRIM